MATETYVGVDGCHLAWCFASLSVRTGRPADIDFDRVVPFAVYVPDLKISSFGEEWTLLRQFQDPFPRQRFLLTRRSQSLKVPQFS